MDAFTSKTFCSSNLHWICSYTAVECYCAGIRSWRPNTTILCFCLLSYQNYSSSCSSGIECIFSKHHSCLFLWCTQTINTTSNKPKSTGVSPITINSITKLLSSRSSSLFYMGSPKHLLLISLFTIRWMIPVRFKVQS